MRFTVDRIDHIVLNVTDVEITAAWYQRVLGMEREDFGPAGRTALKFGGTCSMFPMNRSSAARMAARSGGELPAGLGPRYLRAGRSRSAAALER